MRVLCAGDLHLGRRASRLPGHVVGRAVSCARAWEAIVELALAQRVGVVALSGDLVDRANRYFEAVGPLEHGIRRLADAGIACVAVAGNHDHDVLPQLADVLGGGLRLLGRGGCWERATLDVAGERLHVDGWSFPTEHVTTSPLATYSAAPPDGAPVLGLLHADLDAPRSAYAPAALADLRAHPVVLWLLGHVHAPALHEGARGAPWVLYPGSPQAMDPGEPGGHGAWLVELLPARPPAVRFVPLATARYERVCVDVSGIEDEGALCARVLERVREEARGVAAAGGPLRHLSLRVRVHGRTALHRRVEGALARVAADLELQVGDVGVYVEQLTADTRPARDLARLAEGADAVAVLARLLRGDGDPAAADALLPLAQEAAGTLRSARAFRPIAASDAGLDAASLRDVLARQASLLLDELLAQREATA